LESWYIQRAARNEVNLSTEEIEAVLNEIWNTLPVHQEEDLRVRRLWPRIAAAASILLILSIGNYFISHKAAPPQIVQNQDIPFGTNQAVLKIGHSKTVVLDSTRNGLIAQQGHIAINKTANGQIIYSEASNATDQTAPVYDTLINPAGSKIYHLNFSDGSKLILNAATTIRFPETFAKNERKVDLLSGEVFFEVNHKETQPFNVYTKGQIIKDLGTQFNISAYQDERLTIVTLLKGSVSVYKGNQSLTLKPGQQGITGKTNMIQLVKKADTDEAIAWKEGMFNFDSEDLASIMRKVSRWYDVSIVYTDDSVKDIPFGAVTTRFANVSQVLKMLERTKEVHFKIVGKKIIVSK
jgi:transmembrane sensor